MFIVETKTMILMLKGEPPLDYLIGLLYIVRKLFFNQFDLTLSLARLTQAHAKLMCRSTEANLIDAVQAVVLMELSRMSSSRTFGEEIFSFDDNVNATFLSFPDDPDQFLYEKGLELLKALDLMDLQQKFKSECAEYLQSPDQNFQDDFEQDINNGKQTQEENLNYNVEYISHSDNEKGICDGPQNRQFVDENENLDDIESDPFSSSTQKCLASAVPSQSQRKLKTLQFSQKSKLSINCSASTLTDMKIMISPETSTVGMVEKTLGKRQRQNSVEESELSNEICTQTTKKLGKFVFKKPY